MEKRYEDMTLQELFDVATDRGIEMTVQILFAHDDDLVRSVLIDVLNGKKHLVAYYPGVSKWKRPSREFFVCGILDGALYAVEKNINPLNEL